jgi:hypothetical protein
MMVAVAFATIVAHEPLPHNNGLPRRNTSIAAITPAFRTKIGQFSMILHFLGACHRL